MGVPDDVLMFWHTVKDQLLKLAALATAYMALPVTSVNEECSFSKHVS